MPNIRVIKRASSTDTSNIVQQANSPPKLCVDNIRDDISERTKSRGDWEFSFANSSRNDTFFNRPSEMRNNE